MTNQIAYITGLTVAALELGSVESLFQSIGTLSGTGLLIWLVLHKTKERDKDKTQFQEELRELRKENHELSRELGKKCSNCKLANAANDMLKHAGEDHIDQNNHHEKESRY